MARQVAALPKKTFELYRSKKILSSGDHAFFPPGSNQILKDKLAPNSFSLTTTINNLPRELSKNQIKEDINGPANNPVGEEEKEDPEVKPKSRNKKKRKSKKCKVPNSLQESSVANSINSTEEPNASNLEMKHKVLGPETNAPLHVSMNTNLVADIANGRDLEMTQTSKTIDVDLRSCGSSSSNDSGIVTPDSGLVEPHEISDSGVDANSLSSCEMSCLQVETQRDMFNQKQCVDYLCNAWKKVMLEAKEGHVIYFSVDSNPVLCEQKRKQQAANKMRSKQH